MMDAICTDKCQMAYKFCATPYWHHPVQRYNIAWKYQAL
jgi:hypothetical protein